MNLRVRRFVDDFGQVNQLLLLSVKEEDLARLVLKLGSEGTVAAVAAKRRPAVAAQVHRRNRADNLPVADAVVLIEIDRRLLRAVLEGGEGDEEFLLGRSIAGWPRDRGKRDSRDNRGEQE